MTMIKDRLKYLTAIFFMVSLCIGVSSTLVMGAVEVSFLYRLSDFSGPIPFHWATVHTDAERNEIYVVDPHERDVRVFNDSGMEVFRFGDDGTLGSVADVVVEKEGNILVISRRDGRTSLTVCNFRGEPGSELNLRNVPPDFIPFSPDNIAYRAGRVYLLDRQALKIVVIDEEGLFRQGYDVGAILGIKEGKRAETEMAGFSIDSQGNILFTIPVKFTAYKLSPDGTIHSFGTPGSAPGKFGVVGDIVADEADYYYVADRLRSVVLIFDRDFRFIREFGYRGGRPMNLIGPRHLVLDPKGRLYVSQLRYRGVSVFKITHD
jgi:hypothetical protein